MPLRNSPTSPEDPLTHALDVLHETGADRDPVIKRGIAVIRERLKAHESRDLLVRDARTLVERAMALEDEPMINLVQSNPEVAAKRLEDEFEEALLRHQFGLEAAEAA